MYNPYAYESTFISDPKYSPLKVLWINLILRYLTDYCIIMLENPMSTDIGAFSKDTSKTIDLEILSSCCKFN